jgi:hypothetical protein
MPIDDLAEMETVDREGDHQEEQAPEKNGVLSESGFGWVKKLNLFGRNDREPKYDLLAGPRAGSKWGNGRLSQAVVESY